MAYINTDVFLELFAVASAGQDKQFINTVKMVLEDTPTADVVEVVRCKDCKHAILDLMEKGLAVCRRPVLKNGQLLPFNWENKYNDFCSYGERKDGE